MRRPKLELAPLIADPRRPLARRTAAGSTSSVLPRLGASALRFTWAGPQFWRLPLDRARRRVRLPGAAIRRSGSARRAAGGCHDTPAMLATFQGTRILLRPGAACRVGGPFFGVVSCRLPNCTI